MIYDMTKIAKRIEKTAVSSGIKPETLCFYAVNSSSAWKRLISGRLTLKTIQRIEAYMASHAKEKTRKPTPQRRSSAGKAGLPEHTKRGCARKSVKALPTGGCTLGAKPRKASTTERESHGD